MTTVVLCAVVPRVSNLYAPFFGTFFPTSNSTEDGRRRHHTERRPTHATNRSSFTRLAHPHALQRQPPTSKPKNAPVSLLSQLSHLHPQLADGELAHVHRGQEHRDPAQGRPLEAAASAPQRHRQYTHRRQEQPEQSFFVYFLPAMHIDPAASGFVLCFMLLDSESGGGRAPRHCARPRLLRNAKLLSCTRRAKQGGVKGKRV